MNKTKIMLPIEYYIEEHVVEGREVLMQKAICDEFNITMEQMYSRNKRKEVSEARYTYYYLAWKHCYYATISEIGASIERNHSNVSRGITKMKETINIDYNFTRKLTRIEKKLNL